MRPLSFAVAWLLPLTAFAQLDAPPEPPLPPPPAQQPSQDADRQKRPAEAPIGALPEATPPPPARSRFESLVRAHKPSPQWTQDRSFTSTRFWLLDPGNYEVQTWFRTRIPHEAGGTRGPSEFLLQQEIEIGLVPHLQLDLYENVTFNIEDGRRGVQQEGVQIEARIAIPSYYGQMPLNPVIYIEWHARHNNPDRAEIRLLLGGAPTRWLYLVANPFAETNIESTDVTTAGLDAMGMPAVLKTSKYLADAEVGTTLAAGFRITDWLRLSAEMRIAADMLGDENNKWHFVWMAGPGFILKPLPRRYANLFKIMGTFLIAIPPTDPAAQQFEPLVILGSQF